MGRDRWSAVGLALVAIGYLLAARGYPLDTLAAPGPGLVPWLAGLALLLIAIWLFATTGRVRAPGAPPRRITASPFLLAVTLVLYAAALPRAGFLAASFALVAVAARLMGLAGWWRPALLALGVTAVSHVVFARWLGVPLP